MLWCGVFGLGWEFRCFVGCVAVFCVLCLCVVAVFFSLFFFISSLKIFTHLPRIGDSHPLIHSSFQLTRQRGCELSRFQKKYVMHTKKFHRVESFK